MTHDMIPGKTKLVGSWSNKTFFLYVVACTHWGEHICEQIIHRHNYRPRT